MAQTSNEITEKLFEAVDTIIGERISSLPYDQTIVAQIINADDHANGIYIVTHDYNTEFKAYADYTGFQIGDQVYVRIPEGDYTKQKVITGKYLEGLITASETHNIISSGDQSYYVYDKNNLIHSYNQCKIDREITFSYFNSIDATKTWKNVMNTYSGDQIDYERPKAIKIVINKSEDITIYLHKYRPDPKNANEEYFAAEQVGIYTDFLQDVEQGARFIPISPNFQWREVEPTTVFNPKVKYYTRTGTDTSNYEYTLADIEEFEEEVTYYCYYDINYPIELQFYKKINASILDNSVLSNFELIDDLLNLNNEIQLYYYNSGELELKIPDSLPMIQSMSIYYNDGIHIKYTIAKEFKASNAKIPIYVQFCPIDETYNVTNSVNISFGYLTELNEEINGIIQLIRNTEDGEDIVSAVYIGDYSSPGVINEGVSYYLKILLQNKNGDFIKSSDFKYRWRYFNSNSNYQDLEDNIIPIQFNSFNINIGYQIQILTENNSVYETYYFPLAFTSSLSYYTEIPTIIRYNQQGINPQYYNSTIKFSSYNVENIIDNYIISIANNTIAQINNNILQVYNYYNKDEITGIIISDSDGNILWYQTILFIKDYQKTTIINRPIPLNTEANPSAQVLVAQSTEQTGLILLNNNNILELNCYNNQKSPSRIFHLDSSGGLQIGYNDFTMTGHITEGSTYLENLNKEKYNVGNNLLPVYFANGIPVKINPIGSNKAFIYLTGEGLSSKTIFDTNNKLIANFATSHIISVSANKTLVAADNGKFLRCTDTLTITLPNLTDNPGFECEVYFDTSSDNKKLTFQAVDNVKLYCMDVPEGATSLCCEDPRGIIVLKYVGTDHWLLAGSVEENT